jgi:hypothetical protein
MTSIRPNILSQYASYNYLWSFGILSQGELNSPSSTYKANGPSNLIIRSGGIGNDKTDTTAEEDFYGINVEYFIEDVNIDILTTPNNRSGHFNAGAFEFTVLEPYSIGLFLQQIQQSALANGYGSYLEAPFCLSLDFIGYDDEGNIIKVDTPRHFVVSLIEARFTVDNTGSTYQVSAVPWNEQA